VPDLVVSDVMMPRLDGLALVAALRTDPRTAAVPVLLLSARAGQEDSIEGLQAGADDYLVKPFAAAELLARVRSIIELARLRNHHARWRTALVDSLQEAFLSATSRAVIDQCGVQRHSWVRLRWPALRGRAPVVAVRRHRSRLLTRVNPAFAELLDQPHGTFTIPVDHRDRHRRG
jgi:CheY-like chemotaxis protein